MVVLEFIMMTFWAIIALRFLWISCFGGQFTYQSEGFFPWLLFKIGKPTPAYADRRWMKDIEGRILAGQYVDEQRTMYNGDVYTYKAVIEDNILKNTLHVEVNEK